MNKRDLAIHRNQVISRYHSKSGSWKPIRNAVMIIGGNTKSHELKKAEVAFDLIREGKQIVTEAVRNSDGRIVDVVDLDSGEEIEIVNKNRDPKVLQRYKEEGVNVIYV